MKIERLIYIFKKNSDEVIKEIDATDLSISVLKNIFTQEKDDPNFYKPYKILQSQHSILLNYKKELEMYPCKFFDLYLEAFSVDN